MNINSENRNLFNQTYELNNKTTDELSTHYELIQIIKRFEFCSGWTLLIAPENLPKKDILKHYNVNLDKVLIIHKKHCSDILFTAYKGLTSKTCSALVVWDGLISKSELALLNAKAKTVDSELYLINKNTHDLNITHH